MAGSSKILTVKYGTFSCTAEGFEDPLAAVKSTTQYFRNVAREDHFFGSEPPAFDPVLAEELLRRRIASDLRNEHLTVRPAPIESRRPADADRPDAHDSPDRSMPTAEAQSDPATPAAVPEPAPETVDPDAMHATPPNDGAEPEIVEQATHAAQAPDRTVDDQMAAKLSRIRAVVGAPSADPETEAPPAPEGRDAARIPSPAGLDPEPDETDAPHAGPDDRQPWTGIAPGDGPTPDVAPTGSGGDASSAPNGTERADTAPPAALEEDEPDPSTDDLEAMLASIRAQATEDLDNTPYGAAANTASDEAHAAPETEPPNAGNPGKDETAESVDATVAPQAANAREEALDRTTSGEADRTDIAARAPEEDRSAPPETDDEAHAAASETVALPADEAAAPEPQDETVATAIHAPSPTAKGSDADSTTAEPRQSPRSRAGRLRARVLAVKRAALDRTPPISYDEEDENPVHEGQAETGEEGTPLLGERSDRLRAQSTLSPEEEAELARELAAVRAELGAVLPDAPAPEKQAPLRLDNPVFEEETDTASDTSLIARASAGARRAVRMASPARAMLTEKSVEDGDTSRLIDQANSELDEPEGNRRRSAIAHLRAAVAATRADRALRAEDDAAPSTPYREDLAKVVRPRRPKPQAGPRTARPATEPGPAPLQLVADQRVAEANEPVRPRRVLTGAELASDADDGTGGGFADYAESVGARSLPDLLEAAAAYMAFVEGHDQFSRPQLMTVLQKVEAGRTTREERLRSFGRLLRDGKIEKTRGGRFTASENIGFRPDARQAG